MSFSPDCPVGESGNSMYSLPPTGLVPPPAPKLMPQPSPSCESPVLVTMYEELSKHQESAFQVSVPSWETHLSQSNVTHSQLDNSYASMSFSMH